MPAANIPPHSENDRVQRGHRGQHGKNGGNLDDFAVPTPKVSVNTPSAVRTGPNHPEMLEKKPAVFTVPAVFTEKTHWADLSPDWWSASDWRAYYNYRASRLVNDDVPLQEARLEAYRATMVHWLDTHMPGYKHGLCAHCAGDESHGMLVPFGVQQSGIVWLHHACWPEWTRRQTRAARKALAACGIVRPLTR